MIFKNAHIISYRWNAFSPLLTIYHRGKTITLDISTFEHMEMSLSKGMWCVGRFINGEYIPCPDTSVVGEFRQCEKCALPTIPIQSCIFEPKCDGSLCGIEFCSREHVVYLAFFGDLIKVGMTSMGRIYERAIEQGADAFAVIKNLPNRLAARTFEKHLSTRYGISQAHTSKEVLKQMMWEINRDSIKMNFTRILFDISGEIDGVPDLVFLEKYPIKIPVRREPILRPAPTTHAGKIIGIKGRFIIYERSGIYALDLSDAVGRRANIIFR